MDKIESFSPRILLREAKSKDCELLWKWRNEEEVRQWFFNSTMVPYEEHKAWFSQKLNSPNTKILIICNKNKKEIGQVRLDISNDQSCEISISLDRRHRNRGYGTAALKLAYELASQVWPNAKFVAHIKKENIASIEAFTKAGFKNNGLKYVEGQEAIEMVWKNAGNEKI